MAIEKSYLSTYGRDEEYINNKLWLDGISSMILYGVGDGMVPWCAFQKRINQWLPTSLLTGGRAAARVAPLQSHANPSSHTRGLRPSASAKGRPSRHQTIRAFLLAASHARTCHILNGGPQKKLHRKA